MALRPDFVGALATLARVFGRYHALTGQRAVLVGGAAVNLVTDGDFHSGDFDVHADADAALDAAFLAEGFERERRQGRLHIGYWHGDHPDYGFQAVSGRLFDGFAARIRLWEMIIGEAAGITLPAVEDLIADRLGQYAAAAPGDVSRLLQAQAMFSLVSTLNKAYLLTRIQQDGGDPALLPWNERQA